MRADNEIATMVLPVTPEAKRLTTAQLMSKDRALSSSGAVPPLVSELALALGNGQPCSFLDAGQQEVLPTT